MLIKNSGSGKAGNGMLFPVQVNTNLNLEKTFWFKFDFNKNSFCFDCSPKKSPGVQHAKYYNKQK